MGATCTIVRTGLANTASVVAMFRRLGVDTAFASSPEEVLAADLLVLPGVGAFGPGMSRLSEDGTDRALRARIGDDRPTLCVCLGMQLLFDESEEAPGVRGLAIARGRVERFVSAECRVPQLGWNRIDPVPGCELLGAGHACFANSYRVELPPEGWNCAFGEHGGRYVAAMERGRTLACQFHPELSGPWGAALVGRWLERAGVPSGERVASC